jgi:signal transduction histidine kinase
MRERVRHFNGHLEIESNENGTVVTANFPAAAESASSEENGMYRKAGG